MSKLKAKHAVQTAHLQQLCYEHARAARQSCLVCCQRSTARTFLPILERQEASCTQHGCAQRMHACQQHVHIYAARTHTCQQLVHRQRTHTPHIHTHTRPRSAACSEPPSVLSQISARTLTHACNNTSKVAQDCCAQRAHAAVAARAQNQECTAALPAVNAATYFALSGQRVARKVHEASTTTKKCHQVVLWPGLMIGPFFNNH